MGTRRTAIRRMGGMRSHDCGSGPSFPDLTPGEIREHDVIRKQARIRCVVVGVNDNDLNEPSLMRLSRKSVASATHAVPEVRFEEQDITSFGGLVVLQPLLNALDLRRRLRQAVRHLPSSGAYCPSRIVLLLIVHAFLGWRRLRDLDYYRSDPVVKRLLGLERLPDVSTVSRRLGEFDEQSVDNLRDTLRSLVTTRALAASPRRLTLDLDGSVISTKARGIEGTAVGYNTKRKGARSYYPLLAVMAQTGQVYDMLHRAGNVHDSRGALQFALESEERLRTAGFKGILEMRVDSAHYSDATCGGLHERGIEFSVSVPFERLPELKSDIENRVLWQRIDDECSYFEQSMRPSVKSSHTFRCIVYRQRRAVPRKGPIQLELFEPVDREYEYKAVMTNRRQRAAAVLRFHDGRGSQEATFGEAKSHLGFGYLPSRREVSNQVYLISNLIAHALGRELQMRMARPQTKNTAARACLWTIDRLGTFRNRIVRRAARVIRPNGNIVVSFARCGDVETEIRHYVNPERLAA